MKNTRAERIKSASAQLRKQQKRRAEVRAPWPPTELRSATLRKEIADVERRLTASRQASQYAGVQSADIALAAHRGEPGAQESLKKFEALATKSSLDIRRLSDAQAALVVQLQGALEYESAEDAKALAEEARQYAGEVAKLGADADRALRSFTEAMADIDDAMNYARSKGWISVTQEHANSLMVRAFKSELSHIAQRLDMRPIGVPERRSFAQTCMGWADAVAGSAARILRDQDVPPSTTATPSPPVQSAALTPSAVLSAVLDHPDPATPLADDDPSFRVFENVGEANAAHREAMKGPAQ